MSAAGGRRLILLEDHVADLSRHRYLAAAGYRIIRRYENKRLVGAARFHCWGPMVGPMGDPAQCPTQICRAAFASRPLCAASGPDNQDFDLAAARRLT